MFGGKNAASTETTQLSPGRGTLLMLILHEAMPFELCLLKADRGDKELHRFRIIDYAFKFFPLFLLIAKRKATNNTAGAY